MFFVYKKNKKKQLQHQVRSVKKTERASQFAPFSLAIGEGSGSITVEAALVFPLFLMASYALMCIAMMLITEQEIYNGLMESARYSAKYKYLSEKMESETVDTVMLNPVTLHYQMTKHLDERKLHFVKGGSGGISLLKSSLDEENQVLILRANTTITIPIPFFGDYTYKLNQSIYQKAFVGYREEDEFSNGEYVYVAETGKVYHLSMDCSHIALKIVSVSQIGDVKAKRYCSHCMKNGQLTGNYATVCGDCIHNNINCSTLKRTVRLVRKDQLNGLPLCKRCGKK